MADRSKARRINYTLDPDLQDAREEVRPHPAHFNFQCNDDFDLVQEEPEFFEENKPRPLPPKEEKKRVLPISQRLLFQSSNVQAKLAVKLSSLRKVMPTLPETGEVVFLLGFGDWDSIHTLPIFIEKMGFADEVFFVTWTCSHPSAQLFVDLLERGKIKHATVIAGELFMSKNSPTCVYFREELEKRGHRFGLCRNHAKIFLIANHANNQYFCISGSANATSNPRCEQAVIINSKEVYDFNVKYLEMMRVGKIKGQIGIIKEK